MGRRLAAVALAAVTALGGATMVAACGSSEPRGKPGGTPVDAAVKPDVRFTIPSGASTAANTESVLPARITLKRGQVIQIVNEDSIGYDIGPFYVGAGETLTNRVNVSGAFSSSCRLHRTGTITVEIT